MHAAAVLAVLGHGEICVIYSAVLLTCLMAPLIFEKQVWLGIKPASHMITSFPKCYKLKRVLNRREK